MRSVCVFLLLLLLFTSIILIQGSSDEQVGSHDDSNFSNLKSKVRIEIDQNKKDAREDDAARVQGGRDRVHRDIGDRVHGDRDRVHMDIGDRMHGAIRDRVHRDVGDRVHRDVGDRARSPACQREVHRCKKERILKYRCEGREPRCCQRPRCQDVKDLCDNPFDGLTLSVQFEGKQLPCECVESVCEKEFRNEYRKSEIEKKKYLNLTEGHCCDGKDSDFNKACPAEMKSIAPKCRMVLIGWWWIPCQKTSDYCVEKLKKWRKEVEDNQEDVLQEWYESKVKLWESHCCQSSSVFYRNCPAEMAAFGKLSHNLCH